MVDCEYKWYHDQKIRDLSKLPIRYAKIRTKGIAIGGKTEPDYIADYDSSLFFNMLSLFFTILASI